MPNPEIEKLRAAVLDESNKHQGNPPPDAETYRRHAEALGLKTQWICTSGESTGAYYSVLAIYDGTKEIFGTIPLAIIFEDFSRATYVTWVFCELE